MKCALLLPALLVLAACSAGPSGNPAVLRAAAEGDVREAVFRHLFARNDSGLQQGAKVYFVSVGGADPSPEFLARFAGETPPVKPASDCDATPDRGVLDRETGERGLLFTIESIEWVSDREAVVNTRYYEAGLSAAVYRLTLRRSSDAFEVTAHELLRIS